jgi:hypothetical protein
MHRKFRINGEEGVFFIAVGLYLWGLLLAVRTGGGLRWNEYPVLIPTALLLLCSVNRRLRSKLVGWGVFSLAFACLLAVLGAFVIQFRLLPDSQWILFLRALALYSFIGLLGLYQLRFKGTEHA